MTKKYVSTYCKKEVKELPKRKPIKLSKAVQFSVKCRKQNKKKVTNKRCIPVSEKKSSKEGKQHCDRIESIGEENQKKTSAFFDQTN